MHTAVPLTWLDARYEVTHDGKVLSWADSHGGRATTPRLLKQHVTNSGYVQVRLPVAGKFKWVSVARLMLQAFTGEVGEQVNHKNGVRTDNRLENLEWVTRSENMLHSYRVLGRQHPRPHKGKFGALNWHSKPVAQFDLSGRLVRTWDALQTAARAGFSAGNISAVCRGLRSSHKGFVWKYVA